MNLLDLAERPAESCSHHKRPSRVELVRDYFIARPNAWIDGLAFESFAGRYAWRSRISDARRKYGMTIENRERRVMGLDGQMFVRSEYRYVPT